METRGGVVPSSWSLRRGSAGRKLEVWVSMVQKLLQRECPTPLRMEETVPYGCPEAEMCVIYSSFPVLPLIADTAV